MRRLLTVLLLFSFVVGCYSKSKIHQRIDASDGDEKTVSQPESGLLERGVVDSELDTGAGGSDDTESAIDSSGTGGTDGSGGFDGIDGRGGTGGMVGNGGSGVVSGAGGTGGVTGDGGSGAVGGTGGTAGSSGDCPEFKTGPINFMGVDDIMLEVGQKPITSSAPMVFYWHGPVSTSNEYISMASAVLQGVLAEGGILVSFQNSSKEGDASCSFMNTFYTGDFDIADQLVDCAIRDHNIDRRRIYTTGCSAGGLFAACMAAHRSSYIAAVATNSGGFDTPQPFQDYNTPALMTMHGGPNDIVEIDFTQASATADRVFKDRGGFVINCNHDRRHCGGYSLTPYVWEFFRAHPYGANPSPWVSGLPTGFSETCEVF